MKLLFLIVIPVTVLTTMLIFEEQRTLVALISMSGDGAIYSRTYNRDVQCQIAGIELTQNFAKMTNNGVPVTVLWSCEK